MVQYAEIKSVEGLIDKFKKQDINVLTLEDIDETLAHLISYHEHLEGWYGDEQYHMEKDLEL